MTDQCFRCYLAGGLAVLIPVAYLMFVNVLIDHLTKQRSGNSGGAADG